MGGARSLVMEKRQDTGELFWDLYSGDGKVST